MLVGYVAALCRIVIGLAFSWSFMGKIRQPQAFVQTIRSFRLLPVAGPPLAAALFLIAEGAIVGCMTLGAGWVGPGFALAGGLLLLFTGALMTVLVRRQATSCNCFGPSDQPVVPLDVVRNAGFLVWAGLGWVLDSLFPTPPLTAAGWLLAVVGAGLFVVGWLHLRELTQLFRWG